MIVNRMEIVEENELIEDANKIISQLSTEDIFRDFYNNAYKEIIRDIIFPQAEPVDAKNTEKYIDMFMNEKLKQFPVCDEGGGVNFIRGLVKTGYSLPLKKNLDKLKEIGGIYITFYVMMDALKKGNTVTYPDGKPAPQSKIDEWKPTIIEKGNTVVSFLELSQIVTEEKFGDVRGRKDGLLKVMEEQINVIIPSIQRRKELQAVLKDNSEINEKLRTMLKGNHREITTYLIDNLKDIKDDATAEIMEEAIIAQMEYTYGITLVPQSEKPQEDIEKRNEKKAVIINAVREIMGLLFKSEKQDMALGMTNADEEIQRKSIDRINRLRELSVKVKTKPPQNEDDGNT